MVTSFPFAILVGAVCGFLAGLGIGGGSLLLLWLTMIIHTDTDAARSINLLFFLASAGSVTLLRWKKGSLDLKRILPAILGGCLSAGVLSCIRPYCNADLLRKLYGILLLVTGLRELFYRPRKLR